jgi:hypothetical protein
MAWYLCHALSSPLQRLDEMARAAVEHSGGSVGTFKPLSYEDVLSIYKAAS